MSRSQIASQLYYAEKRVEEYEAEIPLLEAKRDYADRHGTAHIWYNADVDVKRAYRHKKHWETEARKLRRALGKTDGDGGI